MIRKSETGFALLAIVGATLSGCAMRNDPHANSYAPPGGSPPLLESADILVQDVEDLVLNLDERIEHAVY